MYVLVLLALLLQITATRICKHADTLLVPEQTRKVKDMTSKNNTPTPGWWAVQHNIGNDRRWALLPENQVLACVGLYLTTTGYCIAFETEIITEAELSRHIIIGAASTDTVLAAARHLIAAGLWTEMPGVGIDCGAAEHIKAKTERIDRARRGGEAKAANAARIPEMIPFGSEEALPL